MYLMLFNVRIYIQIYVYIIYIYTNLCVYIYNIYIQIICIICMVLISTVFKKDLSFVRSTEAAIVSVAPRQAVNDHLRDPEATPLPEPGWDGFPWDEGWYKVGPYQL